MPYELHPVIQKAYSSVHRWLESRDDTAGYMKIDERKISQRLDRTDMKHIAAQFSVLFPTHYFKCLHAFNTNIGYELLLDWVRHNPYVTLIDMGCGAGAASAAFISVLLNLSHSGELANRVRVVCIGVDLVENVIGVYYRLLASIECQDLADNIHLEVKVVDRPAAESVTDLDELLGSYLREWNQPALTHVFLAQSNIVRPLGTLFDAQNTRRDRMSDLGIPSYSYIVEDMFGIREARSYRQILRQIPIDNLHFITVGTDDDELIQRVKQMGESVQDVFARYEPKCLATGIRNIKFTNPKDSYWLENRSKSAPVDKEFAIDVRSVENTSHKGDLDWHRVIAVENLELAWARARALLQRDVLYDEIEIRLFERNLKANLERLHQELVSYDTNVARTSERMYFKFVKKQTDSRPRVLSRIEEEIVSIAIVQELGAAAFGLNASSYAYRPNPRFASRSEFLYEYWFSAYRRYKEESRNAVAKHSNCKVLAIDIKSYFTEIPQKSLVESVQKETRTQSARIVWLLQALLCVKLKDHCQNRGLTQGGAGSGFYANAYLTEFDSKFGINNLWDAQLFRFVDDIVIVIPDPAYLNEVKDTAIETMDELGLKVNQEKSDDFDQNEYLNLPQDEGVMNGLSEEFDDLTKPLWLTNSDIRNRLRQPDEWWKLGSVDILQRNFHKRIK